MGPSEIIERIAITGADPTVFEMLRPMSFADRRSCSSLTCHEADARLLFAVLALAIRDWLTWNARIERAAGTVHADTQIVIIRRRLREVNEWLFAPSRSERYGLQLAAEIFRFDVGAFRRVPR